MSSVQAMTLIRGALARIGVLDPFETPGNEQIATCLDALNAILDANQLSPGMASNNSESVVTLAGSAQSLTIGPSLQIDVPRPVRVVSAYARLGNIDQPIRPVDKAEWDGILIKGLGASWPEVCWYDGGLPTGTVYFWPLPSAPVEIHITTLTMLQPFASSTDSQQMPQGMQRALTLMLATDVAPMFGLSVDPRLEQQAVNAVRLLRRAASSVPQLDTGPRMSSRLGRFLAGY